MNKKKGIWKWETDQGKSITNPTPFLINGFWGNDDGNSQRNGEQFRSSGTSTGETTGEGLIEVECGVETTTEERVTEAGVLL